MDRETIRQQCSELLMGKLREYDDMAQKKMWSVVERLLYAMIVEAIYVGTFIYLDYRMGAASPMADGMWPALSAVIMIISIVTAISLAILFMELKFTHTLFFTTTAGYIASELFEQKPQEHAVQGSFEFLTKDSVGTSLKDLVHMNRSALLHHVNTERCYDPQTHTRIFSLTLSNALYWYLMEASGGLHWRSADELYVHMGWDKSPAMNELIESERLKIDHMIIVPQLPFLPEDAVYAQYIVPATAHTEDEWKEVLDALNAVYWLATTDTICGYLSDAIKSKRLFFRPLSECHGYSVSDALAIMAHHKGKDPYEPFRKNIFQNLQDRLNERSGMLPEELQKEFERYSEEVASQLSSSVISEAWDNALGIAGNDAEYVSLKC